MKPYTKETQELQAAQAPLPLPKYSSNAPIPPEGTSFTQYIQDLASQHATATERLKGYTPQGIFEQIKTPIVDSEEVFISIKDNFDRLYNQTLGLEAALIDVAGRELAGRGMVGYRIEGLSEELRKLMHDTISNHSYVLPDALDAVRNDDHQWGYGEYTKACNSAREEAMTAALDDLRGALTLGGVRGSSIDACVYEIVMDTVAPVADGRVRRLSNTNLTIQDQDPVEFFTNLMGTHLLERLSVIDPTAVDGVDQWSNQLYESITRPDRGLPPLNFSYANDLVETFTRNVPTADPVVLKVIGTDMLSPLVVDKSDPRYPFVVLYGADSYEEYVSQVTPPVTQVDPHELLKGLLNI